MARIYFNPDKDELITTRKLTAQERVALERMLTDDADDTDADFTERYGKSSQAKKSTSLDEEMEIRLDDLEEAIRENTEAIQMNSLAVQTQHSRDLDTAATIAGGILGFKLCTDVIDGISDAFNPFFSGCECKKKKWF